MFLKRIAVDGVTLDKLFIGSILTVHARQLKVVDYGDTCTRSKFARGKETTFAMIKPDVYMHTGKIIDSIYKSGFIISKLKMSRFNAGTATKFLQNQMNEHQVATTEFLQSDVSTGMELVGEGAL